MVSSSFTASIGVTDNATAIVVVVVAAVIVNKRYRCDGVGISIRIDLYRKSLG